MVVGLVAVPCCLPLPPHVDAVGAQASAGCVSSLLDVVRMECVEVHACMSVGMCDELWYITGTLHLSKPQPILLNLILLCVTSLHTRGL